MAEELEEKYRKINNKSLLTSIQRSEAIGKDLQQVTGEKDLSSHINKLAKRANSDVRTLWTEGEIVDYLTPIASALESVGVINLPNPEDVADRVYAFVESQKDRGLTRFQRFNTQLAEAANRVLDKTQLKSMEKKEKQLEELDKKISKAKTQGDGNKLLLFKSQRRKVESALANEREKWLKHTTNISNIKRTVYAESLKQKQIANNIYLSEAGIRYVRWCLSPFHPYGDICDVCAKHVWLTEEEKRELLAYLGQRRYDFRGVIKLENVDPRGLVIPELVEWSDEEIATAIYEYGEDGTRKIDPRRKLAGKMPPHPWCKCYLRPIINRKGKNKWSEED